MNVEKLHITTIGSAVNIRGITLHHDFRSVNTSALHNTYQ